MNIELYIEISEINNGKKVIEKTFKANSLVRGYVDILQSQMSQAIIANGWTDTSGNNQAAQTNSLNFALNSGAGVTTFGIVVGTGSTAVAIGQTALVTLISHGTGAGALSYGATSIGVPSTVGTTRSFTIARTLTNNSGSPITWNEIGLYAKAASYFLMIDRTLNSTVINHLASKTITYTVSVTV